MIIQHDLRAPASLFVCSHIFIEAYLFVHNETFPETQLLIEQKRQMWLIIHVELYDSAIALIIQSKWLGCCDFVCLAILHLQLTKTTLLGYKLFSCGVCCNFLTWRCRVLQYLPVILSGYCHLFPWYRTPRPFKNVWGSRKQSLKETWLLRASFLAEAQFGLLIFNLWLYL